MCLKIKIMKNIFKLLLIAILVQSCTNEKDFVHQDDGELDMIDVYELAEKIIPKCSECNTVSISATNIAGTTSQISIHKQIKDPIYKNKINKIFVQNNEIKFSDSDFVSINSKNTNFQTLKNSFGESISVDINNGTLKSSNNATVVNVYNPKLIEITNKDALYEIDKNSNITIEWDPDILNDLPISIVLVSRYLESDGSPIQNVHLEKVVNDVGSYTINANELGIFPDKSKLNVALIRGNIEYIAKCFINNIKLYNYMRCEQ